MEFLKRLWNDEEGQGMVEYGLLVALIAVVAIAGLVVLGPKIRDLFTGVAGKINTTIN